MWIIILPEENDPNVWADCGEGPFDTYDQARQFADDEIGVDWQIVQQPTEYQVTKVEVRTAWGDSVVAYSQPVNLIDESAQAESVIKLLYPKLTVERIGSDGDGQTISINFDVIPPKFTRCGSEITVIFHLIKSEPAWWNESPYANLNFHPLY